MLFERSTLIVGPYLVQVDHRPVRRNKKFPDGWKLRLVLVDRSVGMPILLVDNHAPFGFHFHSSRFGDFSRRFPLNVESAEEAKAFFWMRVERLWKKALATN